MPRAVDAFKKSGPAIAPRDDEPDQGAAANQIVRVVPANSAPPITTLGAPSVFAAGQAAKPKRAPKVYLDLDAVEIKKGVPLPPLTRSVAGVNVAKSILERMAPGDMVEVLHRHANSIGAQAKKDGIKVAKRKLNATHTGVWRV